MKRFVAAVLCIALSLTLSSAFAQAAPAVVTIWHDCDAGIVATMEATVNGLLEGQNVAVQFEKKSNLTDQLKLYGNDPANGPDLYFFAHDSVGTFAAMGILAPVTGLLSPQDMAGLIPMTLQAGTVYGEQYLLPVYYETLLFMYNKALWQGEVPATTEELYEYMAAHTDAAAGTYALVNQHSNAYNVAPFLYGFGASIIDENAQPGLDTQAMKDAVAYNQKFAALEADGDYNTVTTLFNEQKAAAIIGGPWLVSGIKEAGIDLGIRSLAEFKLPNGNGLSPFSGVQSLGVLKYAAESRGEELTKVLKAFTDPSVGIALAKSSNCAPANGKAYDDPKVAANEMIMAIKATAETAQPMPNIPEMGAMWGPAETLLVSVNQSGAPVEEAAAQAQSAALQAIADMR
ncbi:MAG: extracellular solute-binding protein [Candidatus Limiplasma sp.]|nr:extracellular solute-binding protein [Candidatus Limiplasma sp.]